MIAGCAICLPTLYEYLNIMKILKKLFPILPIAFLAGCSNPADNVPRATVSSKTNAAAETVQPASASVSRSYVFGPENSSIQFVGSKVTGRHNGGFRKFSGELRAENGHLASAGNKVLIDTTSLWA